MANVQTLELLYDNHLKFQKSQRFTGLLTKLVFENY